MTVDPIVVDAGEVAKGLNATVYIRWSPTFRFRYWLGFKVIAFGARIIGLGLTRLSSE